jgi:hypothetical protein
MPQALSQEAEKPITEQVQTTPKSAEGTALTQPATPAKPAAITTKDPTIPV